MAQSGEQRENHARIISDKMQSIRFLVINWPLDWILKINSFFYRLLENEKVSVCL